MNGEIISKDENSIRVGAGVTDDASLDISMLRVDPVTGYLLVTAISGSAGSGGLSSVARRDQNQSPVCLGYDEDNDTLVEIATDANGYLLCDITS